MRIPLHALVHTQDVLRAVGQELSFWSLVLESLSSTKIFLGPGLLWEVTANHTLHGAGTGTAMFVAGHRYLVLKIPQADAERFLSCNKYAWTAPKVKEKGLVTNLS